ncbi:MAG: hypothetical protein EXS14_05365 [Planctomycetes bacterium]|nr:hypothetical protein [Planctomycetota bacterium]
MSTTEHEDLSTDGQISLVDAEAAQETSVQHVEHAESLETAEHGEHAAHEGGHGGGHSSHGGHGKKAHAPEGAPPGAPLWMLSFADMMTNLLTFFILMAAYTKSDMGIQFDDFIGSIKQDLNAMPLSGSGLGHDTAFQFGAGRVVYRGAHPVNTETLVEADGGMSELNRDRLREVLLHSMAEAGERTLPTPVLFAPGDTALSAGQMELLQQLGSMLATGRYPVKVDGYAFAEGSDVDAGWELSTRRAIAAAGVLEAAGVARERLAITGHGMLLQGKWSGIEGAGLPQNRYGRRSVLITLGEEH